MKKIKEKNKKKYKKESDASRAERIVTLGHTETTYDFIVKFYSKTSA